MLNLRFLKEYEFVTTVVTKRLNVKYSFLISLFLQLLVLLCRNSYLLLSNANSIYFPSNQRSSFSPLISPFMTLNCEKLSAGWKNPPLSEHELTVAHHWYGNRICISFHLHLISKSVHCSKARLLSMFALFKVSVSPCTKKASKDVSGSGQVLRQIFCP